MGKLQHFAVEFESPHGVFIAGQAAAGNVIIQLSEATSLSGVHLMVKGESRIHWSEIHGTCACKRRKDNYWADELYVEEKVYLAGSPGGESYQMEAGTHKYPFSFTLPPTVPSSYEGHHGYVRYIVKATVDCPEEFNFNPVTLSAFTVLSVLDLNLEQPQLKEACELSNDKEIESCCCWRSGSISGAVRLQKRCYVPGETIFISMQIVNNSHSEIRNIRASLIENAVYRANVRTTRFSRPVATCKGPERVAAGRTEVLNNIPMVVPPIPPSRLDGCAIINTHYELQLCMKASCTELVIPAEILIGTVPLRETFHYLPSAQFDTDVPSKHPVANQSIIGNFQLEPPSYEECATSGYVDIAEKDSNVLGETRFCPRYPTYRQLSQPQETSKPALAPLEVNVDEL